ncbi:hypothetical protein OG948_32895 [Embleya sp. NBC_00888]|uniref:hypothetical protein n=1 Tax=Embleya sp. NBC_00888 TaxID=2975960 RepID=UPI0038637AF9|nr:hypothetical protein OG948_32895 [Embleya sp. NBC_00888]
MSQAVEFGPNGGPHSIADAVDLAQPVLSWVSGRFDKVRKHLKNKRKDHYKVLKPALKSGVAKGISNVASRVQAAKFYGQNSGTFAAARAYRKYENQAVKAADNRAKVRAFAGRSRAQAALLNQIALGNGRRFAPGIQARSAQRRRVRAQRGAARMGTRAVRAHRRALGFAAQAQSGRDRVELLQQTGNMVPRRVTREFNL